MSRGLLCEALGLKESESPFPWQERLYQRFVDGTIDDSLDLPTGLGKTSVMAIWLVARAHGAALPRRLVYVVDRRAVVDQATEVADQLREFVERHSELKPGLGLSARPLPISTLRGQHVDNREWLEDPSSTAIIVGTVDMVGSRLLFEGYGVSRKMRPYHAGLLGADTLVVLDEAHLVPPFARLLEAIAGDYTALGPRDAADRRQLPAFRLLSLSATGGSSGPSFRLDADDERHPVVHARLSASKRLTSRLLESEEKLDAALAAEAWKLTNDGALPVRCLLYCDRRETAEKAKKALDERARGDKRKGIPGVAVDSELFVGGRRVMERESALRRLRELGFVAGSKVERVTPVFLVATSAGEVGVDLDADHLVCDLVAWERMVQRLGRVNRRGTGQAQAVVLVEPPSKDQKAALDKAEEDRKPKDRDLVRRYERTAAVLRVLQEMLEAAPDGARDASPGAFEALKRRSREDASLRSVLSAATTPAPIRPALTRALVDAWSMTSLKEHTGRPEIGPWLRGWIDEDDPQTAVVWRAHLPVRSHGAQVADSEVDDFFEAAPPHASELLETETYRVVPWLVARAAAWASSSPEHASRDEVVAFSLSGAGDLRKAWTLKALLPPHDKGAKARWERDLTHQLTGATLIVDLRLGGLASGMLDPASEASPRCVDDGGPWMPVAETEPPVIRFRIRKAQADAAASASTADPRWTIRHRFVTERSLDGEPRQWLVVEKWRHDAATEDDRSAGRPQVLDEHQSWAEDRARALAARLGLAAPYADTLGVAARLHDEGKRAQRWQRAFNAPGDALYAKTHGPVNTALLDGYRHEFGSLALAARDSRLNALPADLRDLALHLIAAHHGFARPSIATDGCEDAPPSMLEVRAREVAVRFARLQKQWGPWGLAWWEALLRAADQQASRDNDALAGDLTKERR